jgi:hypothetical protein
MEEITLELDGHLCDPEKKCTKRGKLLRITVKKGDAIIGHVDHKEKKFIIQKDGHIGSIEKGVEITCAVTSNTIEREDSERIAQSFERVLTAYQEANPTCSGWASLAMSRPEFSHKGKLEHLVWATLSSCIQVDRLFWLGLLFVLFLSVIWKPSQ